MYRLKRPPKCRRQRRSKPRPMGPNSKIRRLAMARAPSATVGAAGATADVARIAWAPQKVTRRARRPLLAVSIWTMTTSPLRCWTRRPRFRRKKRVRFSPRSCPVSSMCLKTSRCWSPQHRPSGCLPPSPTRRNCTRCWRRQGSDRGVTWSSGLPTARSRSTASRRTPASASRSATRSRSTASRCACASCRRRRASLRTTSPPVKSSPMTTLSTDRPCSVACRGFNKASGNRWAGST